MLSSSIRISPTEDLRTNLELNEQYFVATAFNDIYLQIVWGNFLSFG